MIKKTTLLVDSSRCKRNIANMQAKAQRHSLTLRPHFKTHQSLMVGQWFKEVGIQKITVSSVSMAQYFASEWKDITIAFPVNILEIEEINQLAATCQLQLLVESVEVAVFLGKEIEYPVGIFIKIDVGAGRSGINPSNTGLIDDVLKVLEESPLLEFRGFLAHAGHTYACRSNEEIEAVHGEELSIMSKLKTQYQPKYPHLNISLGDTPSCSVSENFAGVDEIRPGNFAFYDLMQAQITSCQTNDIAVALACPIVAIHEDRNELVVYGGGVHFSKDRIRNAAGKEVYGQVVKPKGDSWGGVEEGMYVKRLSQEHGIIALPNHQKGKYRVGDVLRVLPVHSCMTADLMKAYTVVGEG